jgi:NADH:ubiquinone oxidoreductase subunit H
MSIGWKKFLPVTLGFIIWTFCMVTFFNFLV